ncbi:MAG: hypothetical protein M0Z55_07750 [Peptococcaceae bacterium]|nr:hypothetical protein [Peptococcaceae bacterium]
MTEINLADLPLIGQGSHSKIYQIDATRCIKVGTSAKHIQMELAVLNHSSKYKCFPKVFECKDNYMIREYFAGPNANHSFSKMLKKFAKTITKPGKKNKLEQKVKTLCHPCPKFGIDCSKKKG